MQPHNQQVFIFDSVSDINFAELAWRLYDGNTLRIGKIKKNLLLNLNPAIETVARFNILINRSRFQLMDLG